nr:ribonuclease H-like domain-containing protein [Tanacetum cinerariifolium]
GNSQIYIDDKGYWDSDCSRHMTGNISYLLYYEPFDGGYVSFGQGGCKITGKGTIKTECIVLGGNFKLTNDTNALLRTPKQHNMYSIDLNNVVPHNDITCLVAKASADEYEPASPIEDDSQGEACPTDYGLEAEQDMINITKTSTLPSDSTPRVTSLAANEGSMQQKLTELMDLCTRLKRQKTEMTSKLAAQDLEISQLKA